MRFRALDGWRGFAAVLVALHHSTFYGHASSIGFFQNSYLFVDFFFVLSGFVITHAYSREFSTPNTYVTFIIRRFGRLWPLHMAVLFLFFVSESLKLYALRHGGMTSEAMPFDYAHSVESLFTNIFLLHSMGVHHALTWNLPSWSISVEFYTYLAFAAFCAIFTQRMNPAVVIVCLGLAVVFLFSSSDPLMATTFDFGFFRCLAGFFCGYIVYRLFVSRRSPPPGKALCAILETGAIVVVAGFISYAGDGKLSILAPLIFGVAIYIFAFEGGPLSGMLRTKVFNRLGAWSYSIYMVHAFLLLSMARVIKLVEKVSGVTILETVRMGTGEAIRTNLPHPLYVMDGLDALYLIIVIIISSLTWRFIEEPSRRFFNRLSVRANKAMLK